MLDMLSHRQYTNKYMAFTVPEAACKELRWVTSEWTNHSFNRYLLSTYFFITYSLERYVVRWRGPECTPELQSINIVGRTCHFPVSLVMSSDYVPGGLWCLSSGILGDLSDKSYFSQAATEIVKTIVTQKTAMPTTKMLFKGKFEALTDTHGIRSSHWSLNSGVYNNDLRHLYCLPQIIFMLLLKVNNKTTPSILTSVCVMVYI